MKHQIKTTKQLGFTLLELLIVMVVLSILAYATVPNFLAEDAKLARIDAVINELGIIGSAAQNYAATNASSINSSLTFAWPDESNSCFNALAEMTSQTYILGINATSTWFGEQYFTSCSTATFSVAINTNNRYAGIIKNTLGSVVINNETATYTVPIPSLLPIIDDYISLLDGSSDTWDAQSKTIANVADVSYTFGKRASQAVYDIGFVCDEHVRDGCGLGSHYNDEITKPNCPNSTPTLIINGISSWGGALVDNWDYSVDDTGSVWQLNFVVGGGLPSTKTLWSYVTKCE